MNLVGGDWLSFWPETISHFATLPQAWDGILNSGIGQSAVGTLWITSYLNFSTFVSSLGVPWILVSLIFWCVPAVLLSFLSGFLLVKEIVKKGNIYNSIGGIVYSANTFFLLVLLGGQFGVALSYSLLPLVFLAYRKLFFQIRVRNAALFSLIAGLQILFDPRIFVLSSIVIMLYSAIMHREVQKKLRLLCMVSSSILCMILYHFFWILPSLLYRTSLIPQAIVKANVDKFFSFAFLENSLSLLHPNWPENVFGKTHFMQAEFLLLPILAFLGLIWITKYKERKELLVFYVLFVIGAFLAKGANDPFGGIYEFLFNHIPLFVMFRDPSKWYVLISTAYTVIIPFSISAISVQLFENHKNKKHISAVVPVVFIIFWVFLLRGLFLDKVENRLHIKLVPAEYVLLKNFIQSNSHFSRTLWIPQWQRFGYFSTNHPAIGRQELTAIATPSAIPRFFTNRNEQLLRDFAVQYIVVPDDTEHEIYTDSKKNNTLQQKYIKAFSNVSFLKRISGFGNIAVFELPNPHDHFWLTDTSQKVTYSYKYQTEYSLKLRISKPTLLIFSEAYDKHWSFYNGNKSISSTPYEKKINSFMIPSGTYEAKVFYEPQKGVWNGLFVSCVSVITSLGYLFMSRRRTP